MQFKSPLRLFVFLIFLSMQVSAATYYVATNGNNANPGTTAQPWATLQYAAGRVQPGDIVIVRAGTYAGFRLERAGTASAPITFKADTGARPLLNSLGTGQRHQSIVEVENFDVRLSYIVIDGFEVTGAPRHGIDIRNVDFITVQNCYSHDNGKTTLGDGIFTAFSNSPKLLNNEVSYNTEHGIYHSNSGDSPTLRGNRSHHNQRAGFHLNGDLSQGGDGQISFALIEKNILWENGVQGASGINCDGVSDSTIRNNLLYNNHASGISLYAIDGAQGSSRNQVYHNTIVMAPNARWCVNVAAATDGQPNPTGNIVKNNILIHPDTRGSITSYSTAQSALQSDYNIVVNRFSQDNGESFITFQQWKASGQDAHSIISTIAALFVDPATGNYKLKASAPALNAGTAISSVTDDLLGVARPQGSGPDMGCYETAGSTPPPPPPPGPLSNVNAANYAAPPLAPDSIVAAFGNNLSTGTAVATSLPLPTTLSGTTVKVTDANGAERTAQLFFVSPTQVNYLLPLGTALGNATVRVTNGSNTSQGTVSIAAVAPGLFSVNASGSGLAAGVLLRVRAGGAPLYEPIAAFDSAQNKFVAVPIDLSSTTDQIFLLLFGTGFRGRSNLTNVAVKVGGTAVSVTYAGAVSGLVGLDQLNIQLPRTLAGRGDVNVEVLVDGKAANILQVKIK